MDLPVLLDPDSHKSSPAPLTPGQGMSIVAYEFRHKGELAETISSVLGDWHPLTTAHSYPNNPVVSESSALRMNLVEIEEFRERYHGHAMFKPPWERDTRASFRARLHHTAQTLHRLHNYMRRRVLFKTDGSLVIANDKVRKGDLLYILLGAEVPFILREDGEGHYRLISEALMSGIMRGEALEGREDIEILKLR
jgi:hypothetical protein